MSITTELIGTPAPCPSMCLTRGSIVQRGAVSMRHEMNTPFHCVQVALCRKALEPGHATVLSAESFRVETLVRTYAQP